MDMCGGLGRIYNSTMTRYFVRGIGNHWNVRFEIWEKDSCGFWGLRVWFSDRDEAWEKWEKIKDEPMFQYEKLPLEAFGTF